MQATKYEARLCNGSRKLKAERRNEPTGVNRPHSEMKKLSHINNSGEASMVDVSSKEVELREARARGEIRLQKATVALINEDRIAKGNVLATARLAGIMAAKRTGALIPLCHP